LAILKEVSLPSQIKQLSPEKIVKVFKKDAKRAVGIKKGQTAQRESFNLAGNPHL